MCNERMRLLIHHKFIQLAGLLLLVQYTFAQPTISSSRIVAGQTVFGDQKKANLFYYIPFDYRLATDGSGKPDFSLIEMRYTGSTSSGDQGTMKYHNLLQFRVTLDLSAQKKLSELQTALKKLNPSAELKILPIKKFSSVLVFAGTGSGESGDTMRMLQPSYAEATDQNAAVNNTYWNERIIGFRLNNLDAQMLEGALQKKQAILSFSYAIYTGFPEEKPEITASGSGQLPQKVKDYFKNQFKNPADTQLTLTLVKANAIGIEVNPETWPSVIQKVDINEKAPARYPLLDVYCYDFNNELRADLYAKKIEIKATGVTGADIMGNFSFKAAQPDQYSATIRFPYAIRFDKPFYYRVTEIGNDGEVRISEWTQKTLWTDILDITTPADKVVRKAAVAEEP